MSSAAGFQPIPYATVYAATKSFLASFSLGLEQELRPHGLRVVTVCPGRIRARYQTEGAPKVERDFSAVYQTPEEVVKDTLKTFDRGGGLVVPGFANKIALFAERFIPRRVVPSLSPKCPGPEARLTALSCEGGSTLAGDGTRGQSRKMPVTFRINEDINEHITPTNNSCCFITALFCRTAISCAKSRSGVAVSFPHAASDPNSHFSEAELLNLFFRKRCHMTGG